MAGDKPMSDPTAQETFIYGHVVQCPHCGEKRHYAQEQPYTPPDQDLLLKASCCMACGGRISQADVIEDYEAERVQYPEVPPEDRGDRIVTDGGLETLVIHGHEAVICPACGVIITDGNFVTIQSYTAGSGQVSQTLVDGECPACGTPIGRDEKPLRTDGGQVEKSINGWLVVDWKSGQHRTRKSKPKQSELGNNELLAKLAIDVTIPKVDIPTLAVDIDVPEPQVYAATIEALGEDELPDWTDAVHEVVENYGGLEKAYAERPDSIDIITSKTMLEVNTRPNPQKVWDYVHELVTENGVGADA